MSAEFSRLEVESRKLPAGTAGFVGDFPHLLGVVAYVPLTFGGSYARGAARERAIPGLVLGRLAADWPDF
jgi:hypothetical protein